MKLCTWSDNFKFAHVFHLLRTTLELNNDGGIGDLFVVLRHLCKQKALRRKLCPGVDHDANLIGKNEQNEQKEQWQLGKSQVSDVSSGLKIGQRGRAGGAVGHHTKGPHTPASYSKHGCTSCRLTSLKMTCTNTAQLHNTWCVYIYMYI